MGGGTSDKLFYKIGEVCELTDTQPYVLRFWESEFPQLAPQKNRSGQRMYRRRDIEMVETIKRLLYLEGYTIAGARKRLDQAGSGGADPAAAEAAPDPERHSEAAALLADPPGPGDREEVKEDVLRELRELLRDMADLDRRLR